MEPKSYPYLCFLWKGDIAIRVHESTIRTCPGSTYLHQAAKTRCSILQETRGMIDHLSQRYASDGFVSSSSKLSHIAYFPCPNSLGFHPEPSQMCIGASVITRISGIPNRLQGYDHFSPPGQSRQLAHLIGSMTACLPAIAAAPLHYHALQNLRSSALGPFMTNYDRPVHLSVEVKVDLEWWNNHLTSRMSHPIHPPMASLTLQTDASTLGLGAYYQETDQRTDGPWSEPEAAHHINWLELKAAFLAIQCFVKQSNCHILLLMDNTVAISYISQKGGTHSTQLCQLALDLWSWCMDRDITVHAEHLPGKLKVIADYESRHLNNSSDWQLDKEIFSHLQQIHGPFSVDLFASFQNTQLEVFYS